MEEAVVFPSVELSSLVGKREWRAFYRSEDQMEIKQVSKRLIHVELGRKKKVSSFHVVSNATFNVKELEQF